MLPISIFAYNFPHKKTQDFIFRILAEGFKISTIYAANARKLNIPPSSIRSKINHIGLLHPAEIAKNFNIEYLACDHDSNELKNHAKNSNSIGIISGARILKPEIIQCFEHGIINFHPGIIPFARGLDALFWSVLNNHPLGVTSHLIDKNIDAGTILEIREMKINKDDTLLDLSERLYELQLDMIPNSIRKTINNEGFKLDNYGDYNKKMNSEQENNVIKMLPKYIEYMTS